MKPINVAGIVKIKSGVVMAEGDSFNRKYEVRWTGYEKTTMEPRSHIHGDLVKEYELTNGVYDFD